MLGVSLVTFDDYSICLVEMLDPAIRLPCGDTIVMEDSYCATLVLTAVVDIVVKRTDN